MCLLPQRWSTVLLIGAACKSSGAACPARAARLLQSGRAGGPTAHGVDDGICTEARDTAEQFADFGLAVPDLIDQFTRVGVQTQNDVNHTLPSPGKRWASISLLPHAFAR